MTIKLYGMILQRKSVTCDLTLIFVGDEENCNNADRLFESATMIKNVNVLFPSYFDNISAYYLPCKASSQNSCGKSDYFNCNF